MNILGFIIDIVVGGVAGWLASMLMKSKSGLVWNIIVGIVGGILGGWVAGLLGIYTVGLASFAVSVAGACLLIWLLRLIKKKV